MGVISREILCGLTYLDIVSCAGMNQRQAAKRLGVGYAYFNQVVKRQGMSHWFAHTRPRARCVCPEDIVKVASEGYTQTDAAFLLGINFGYLRRLVKLWGLRDHFPANGGEASLIGKRGYCV
jgi:hypothetical protein